MRNPTTAEPVVRADADARFRRLVETMPAIVYIETDAGTYVSPRFHDVLGWDVEGTDRSWREFLHPDDRAATEELADRTARTREPYSCQYRLRTASGDWRWFLDEAVFVEDEDGGHWQGVMVDITEQKRAEEEASDLATKYRALVDRLPAVVYIEGEGGSADSPVYISPRYEELLGFTAEERIANPGLWRERLHPDDRDRAIAAAEAAIAEGRFSEDYRLIAKDGRVVWVHDETVLVRGDDGQPLFWQGVLFDITDRKRIEHELRETAAKFRALAEQIPAVTYIERVGGPVSPLYVSPQYAAMFGYTAEERLADPGLWERMLHPDDRDRILAESARITPESGSWALEYRLIHKEGRIVWVRDQALLVRGDDGEPLFWQGVLSDITPLKQAEEELEQALTVARLAAEQLREADRIKNAFLQAVSHDLRSPLSAILGSAVTLQHEDELDIPLETRREMVGGIARKARKLTGLVSDLLDMERLAQGQLEPRLSPVDVGGLVQRVVRETDVLGRRDVKVDAPPVTIAVDDSMVERIVENLLGNAAKHTGPEATVWVRVFPIDGGIVIAVEDDGPGVPGDLREALFEAFRRGPGARDVAGLGLGLSIVARFAELHGGHAWVEDREGGGASFRVLLPYG
jgi:PAS domain S-box-containing protein